MKTQNRLESTTKECSNCENYIAKEYYNSIKKGYPQVSYLEKAPSTVYSIPEEAQHIPNYFLG